MAEFIDPTTGEKFLNVPDEAVEQAMTEFGLVPLAQYEADQAYEAKPFLDKASELGMAAVGAIGRPLEKVRDTLVDAGIAPRISDPYARGEGYSPSSPEMQELAQRHPTVSSAAGLIPELMLTAGFGGLPGIAARTIAGTASGASESAFQQGREYGDVSLKDVGAMGAVSLAAEALPFGVGAVARSALPAARAGVAGLGKAASGLKTKAVRYVTEQVMDEAVDGGLKMVGAQIGGAVGGIPGAVFGYLAGRAISQKFGARISAAVVDSRMAARAAVKPISAESVAVGSGFGSIFGTASKALDQGTSAIGSGNILARASRKAYESMAFDDLEHLDATARADAVRENGKRYIEQTTEQATEALGRQAEATQAARVQAAKRIFDLAPAPAMVQREFAAEQVTAMDRASAAIRATGSKELADDLDEIADQLTPVVVEHTEKMPVSHESGDVLHSLNSAYELLSGNAAELPPEAVEVLDVLREGTQKPELWGDAAEMLKDIRTAADAADQTDISSQTDPHEWRGALTEYAAAMRGQLDMLDKWDVPTDKLAETLDDLDAAIQRGDAVAAEMSAARLGQNDEAGGPDDMDPDDPIRGVLAAAIGESGLTASEKQLLDVMPEGMRRAVGEIQKAHHYEKAMRAVQTGAEMTIKKAARGMVGLGGPSKTAKSDASNERFSAGYSDEAAAFEARRSMLTQLRGDPMALSESMAKSYGDLATTHPETFAGLTDLAGRAAAVLSEDMPASIATSLQHPNGYPPSIDDIRRWSRNYMAVVEPETFLADLASGQAWPEQAQKFAKMYPEKWQELSAEALTAAETRGPQLTPQQATYLDLTFDVGNTIGGMWSDSGAGGVRQANQKRAEAQKQKSQNLGQPRSAGSPVPQSATAALSQGPSNTPAG